MSTSRRRRRASSASKKRLPRDEAWTCEICTYVNEEGGTHCGMCGTDGPDGRDYFSCDLCSADCTRLRWTQQPRDGGVGGTAEPIDMCATCYEEPAKRAIFAGAQLVCIEQGPAPDAGGDDDGEEGDCAGEGGGEGGGSVEPPPAKKARKAAKPKSSKTKQQRRRSRGGEDGVDDDDDGAGECFPRVDWVAVPKALRARRVNRQRGGAPAPAKVSRCRGECGWGGARCSGDEGGGGAAAKAAAGSGAEGGDVERRGGAGG
jgi:hypothetical protein